MLILGLLVAFIAVMTVFLMFIPLGLSARPTLKQDPLLAGGLEGPEKKIVKQKGLMGVLHAISGPLSILNKPLTAGFVGRRLAKDLSLSNSSLNPEQFFLLKELLFAVLLWATLVFIKPSSDLFVLGLIIAVGVSYYAPEFWLKGRKKRVREEIVRDLPDTVDLLGLCVNAGLDFMMALKYVIDKSITVPIIMELQNMLQEINMGKPRRDALRDLARKYELPELSTFSRTLIQADRMGTSVTEALNMLSEDMREARFRRGESLAMKAPLKMLVPLLLCIFPVVAILVAGPVFLDFFTNNPMQKLRH